MRCMKIQPRIGVIRGCQVSLQAKTQEHYGYYPIGIQTFSEIRTKGFLYVDKTNYVYDGYHFSSQERTITEWKIEP